MERLIGFEEAHESFRARFRSFLGHNAVPFIGEWERNGIIDRQLFTAAGESGFLGVDVPGQYGGAGLRDFRYNQIMNEEMQRASLGGAGLALLLHNDNCIPPAAGRGPKPRVLAFSEHCRHNKVETGMQR